MSNRVITHRASKKMPRYEYRHEKTERGERGWQEKVGEDPVEMTITVDLDALIDRLGKKAWRNTSKRSTMCWGLVKVEAKGL